ncbi:hypothetical protein UFOVP53_173 [uncultured Caudovirales phage]|uniref:Uncharacterized protein n=1 Tax=uncultured Caudovirales phage TaxID=2100421 RepID=A0A6J5KSV1_9CAUD|nr:hypothetical protein UFOVP53_173 [uncultured Caudovirales phage]
MCIKKRKLGNDLVSYSIGSYSSGVQLVLRNLRDKSPFPIRRYIRLIVRLFDYQIIFEFRFSNSI